MPRLDRHGRLRALAMTVQRRMAIRGPGSRRGSAPPFVLASTFASAEVCKQMRQSGVTGRPTPQERALR
jgi:hypothetical protein